MKAHRVELLIIDHEGTGARDIHTLLENYPGACFSPRVMLIQTQDIGEWTDDHPLNSKNTVGDEYARLFPVPAESVPCFDCEDGVLRTELKPYKTTTGKGDDLLIPDVPHEVCDKCGDTTLKAEAIRMIEGARKATGVTYRRPRRVPWPRDDDYPGEGEDYVGDKEEGGTR